MKDFPSCFGENGVQVADFPSTSKIPQNLVTCVPICAAIRRYAKDLPAEPSEEEFRLGLRSGIILCNALNKIQQGSVQKVVESPCDPSLIADGAALSAYQYFENLRNFLVAVQELGMPTFEASDLEQAGGHGAWKYSGHVKPTASGRQFIRKNSEPLTKFLSRTASADEKSLSSVCTENEFDKMPSSSFSTLVRAILSNKKPEEIPNLVESVLNKVVEEFEHRFASQNQLVEQNTAAISNRESLLQKNTDFDQESESRFLKQRTIVDQQQTDIKELKRTLSTTKAGMQFMQVKFQEDIHNLGLHIRGLAHALMVIIEFLRKTGSFIIKSRT